MASTAARSVRRTLPITTDPAALAEKADILIDFSVPAALKTNIAACIVAEQSRLLIGTTGLAAAHHEMIDEAAKSIAVLQTGNTSLGVNLLAALVREAAQRLGDDWDIEIVEMHHRHKVDAPSGTALLLGEAAAAGRNVTLAHHSARGRDGMTGPRKKATSALPRCVAARSPATIWSSWRARANGSNSAIARRTASSSRRARSRLRNG
jgi:4-hydroxy-tetrahydrodipicolinate reductase